MGTGEGKISSQLKSHLNSTLGIRVRFGVGEGLETAVTGPIWKTPCVSAVTGWRVARGSPSPGSPGRPPGHRR